MKFSTRLACSILSTVAIATTVYAAPSEEIKQKLANYGFEFGRLNHLVSEAAFDQAISLAENVIVKFGADWCGPCRRITPVLEQLSKNYTDILIISVDIDKFPQFKRRYGFRSIPTTLLIKNGTPTSRTTGYQPFSYWSNKISSEF